MTSGYSIMDKDGNIKVSKYLGFPVDDEGRDLQLIPGEGWL